MEIKSLTGLLLLELQDYDKIRIYKKGKDDVRSYELKTIDKKKGHYQIDEKNSIVIDAYFKNGIFTSFFKVNEIFIIATYTMNKEKQIIFEIISAKTKAVSSTGGIKLKEEDIPIVDSFLVNGRQHAILVKRLLKE